MSKKSSTSLKELAQRLYEERHERDRCFPPRLFGEPEWDLLLALYVAAEESRAVPKTAAIGLARAPHATAMRVIERLVAAKLVTIERDGSDGRIQLIGLTAYGVESLGRYLAAIASDRIIRARGLQAPV